MNKQTKDRLEELKFKYFMRRIKKFSLSNEIRNKIYKTLSAGSKAVEKNKLIPVSEPNIGTKTKIKLSKEFLDNFGKKIRGLDNETI